MARAFTLKDYSWFLAGLAVLLCCCFPVFAKDTDWFDGVWQTDEGLPDNVVTSLAQTPDGYLWVATLGGLMRFDGMRFQDFSPPNIGNAPNHVVRAMYQAGDGRLWLGEDEGVVICVMPGTNRIFTAKDGLPPTRVRLMIEDAEGGLWITYSGPRGVARIKDNVVTRFDAGDALPMEEAARLATDKTGQLWFSKSHELGVFRSGKFQTLLRLDEEATCLAAGRKGGIWITTPTRLLKFEEGGKLEEIGFLPRSSVGQGILLEDRTGAIWMGNSVANGLFRYDGSKFELIPTSYPQITCLMEDREANLWVGTGGGGLNRIRPRNLELLHAEQDRPLQSVRSACEDSAGAIWMVTADGLLARRTGTEQEIVTEGENWPGGRAACVTSDRNGGVWIGTRENGLYHYKNNQFTTWHRKDGLASEILRAVMVSSNGDVWLGMDGPWALQRLRGSEFTSFEGSEAERTIRAMTEDAAGNIWIGTSGGYLLRITGDQMTNETTNYTPRPLSIRCLHAMSDGTLWIGYGDGWGLGRLKEGKFNRITTEQGLGDSCVSQIIEDGRGWIWLAGNHGFFRVPTQQLTDVMEGRTDYLHPIVFGRGERLPGLEANYDNYTAAFLGHDGRPRFATRTGLAVVHTENISDNNQAPTVVLERMAVDGQTVAAYESLAPLHEPPPSVVDLRNPPATLRLEPNHRKLDLEFTALSLTAPENVQFRYRLDGFDDDWIEGGTARSASYTWLPPGDYRFQVIACNNSGVWNENGATVAFTVLPLFWQTWWFRLSVMAIFTLSVIAIVRYVSFRRLRERMHHVEQLATLERERTRIARDIHDDLGNRLTKISLLSGLALRHRGATEQEDGQLEQISSTAREATDALDEIVWAINPRNDVLPQLINYIGQFAIEFLRTADIRCRVDLPEHPPSQPVSAEVRHNVFLVVKESLNNIIRHAGATEVWLRIAVSGESLQIIIEDNGRGLQTLPKAENGDGLGNMNQRMSEIGGSFVIENRTGGGARVSLEIPSLVGK